MVHKRGVWGHAVVCDVLFQAHLFLQLQATSWQRIHCSSDIRTTTASADPFQREFTDRGVRGELTDTTPTLRPSMFSMQPEPAIMLTHLQYFRGELGFARILFRVIPCQFNKCFPL